MLLVYSYRALLAHEGVDSTRWLKAEEAAVIILGVGKILVTAIAVIRWVQK